MEYTLVIPILKEMDRKIRSSRLSYLHCIASLRSARETISKKKEKKKKGEAE